MRIENILFDLDGTLTDPKEGITRSIKYALDKLGKPVPSTEELLWCIGPPLKESLKKILKSDDDTAETALYFYREYFKERGIFENELYPGIPKVLEKLNNKGLKLFVVTSKPYVYANEILTHFNLINFFKDVYGSFLSGKLTDKGELIAYTLKNEKITAKKTLMVGDREHDITGAKENDVISIGVTYGYGIKKELENARADFIVDSPKEIFKIVEKIILR
jgi:phosphoglycolate phosphatase